MRIVYYALLGTFLLSACATQDDQSMSPVATGDMSIYVNMRDIHRCSRISPAIEIDNIPQGTERFSVELADTTDPSRVHGGGTWKNDNSGVIPEGALSRHYLGACPPNNSSRTYEYTVTALSGANQPLAERKYSFTQN